ncbi:MAG: helix-turn-helix domain-containing protein [Lachnospiraceae bacterium]|nr:helix-turn-helix domain-containing protein [Lachnospiraceae bacterium]
MILAEKIMMLRKKNGWSQEELAEQLEISRQSVSKWESGASIPDLDKVIKLSALFGVSTDYLLKDEMETVSYSETEDLQDTPVPTRVVSVEAANEYMQENTSFAKRIAIAVMMCVLSPVLLIVLAGAAELGRINMTEDMAGGIGTAVLLVIIATAVGTMIMSGIRIKKYDYLENEIISLQYGVSGIVEKRKKDFEKRFYISVAVGVMCCITGVVPLLVVGGITGDEFAEVVCVGILLAMVAIGVLLFVWAGVIWSGYEKLLQQGDYTEEQKRYNRIFDEKAGFLPGVYWCTITAVFLGISFVNDNWDRSWIIWPVAGVAFAAVMGITKAIIVKKYKENE